MRLSQAAEKKVIYIPPQSLKKIRERPYFTSISAYHSDMLPIIEKDRVTNEDVQEVGCDKENRYFVTRNTFLLMAEINDRLRENYARYT